MKLLVLYQGRDPEKDQPGYYQGFQRLVAEGVLESHAAIGYLGVAEARGWDALWKEAAQAAAEADAVFLQFFHAPMPDPENGIRVLRELKHHPLIFSSLGDPFGRWEHRVPRSMRVASAHSEVTFLTGMGYVAEQLASAGGTNLVLMPHGCCQARFAAEPENPDAAPEFDVVFIGNRLRARNPLGHFFRTARRRAKFVKLFSRRYGKRFGLFGRGWDGNPSWQGPVPYAQQQETLRRAAVVAAGTPNADYDYYCSDREFIDLAAGVPVVGWAIPGLELVLKEAHSLRLAGNLEEMARLCDRLLELSPAERQQMAQATRRYILAEHTQYNRCRQMIDVVSALGEARRRGDAAGLPHLPFLPAGQIVTAPPRAVLNWRG